MSADTDGEVSVNAFVIPEQKPGEHVLVVVKSDTLDPEAAQAFRDSMQGRCNGVIIHMNPNEDLQVAAGLSDEVMEAIKAGMLKARGDA